MTLFELRQRIVAKGVLLEDVDFLLLSLLDCGRSDLILRFSESCSFSFLKSFMFLIHRYLKGEPLAYLLGFTDFYGLTFKVSEAVLIPRNCTELLIDSVLEFSNNALDIVDVGVGSGAIICTLKHHLPHIQAYGFDIDAEALLVAVENARLHALNITFLQRDLLFDCKADSFDCVVSNPPYIAIDDVALDANVRAYEPDIALFSDDSGLKHLRLLIEQAFFVLRKNGYLFLEHGYLQGDFIISYMTKFGYVSVQSIFDYQGYHRITIGKKL